MMRELLQQCPKCQRLNMAYREDVHDEHTVIYFQCYADEYTWVLVEKRDKEVRQ